MDDAFERLTYIQQKNINKKLFYLAYDCVVLSRGDPYLLVEIIKEKTSHTPYLSSDLLRYCKLVSIIQ